MFITVWFKNLYISERFPDAECQDKGNKFVYCLYKCELQFLRSF